MGIYGRAVVYHASSQVPGKSFTFTFKFYIYATPDDWDEKGRR